jgi:hypothetical protein
MLFFFFSTGTSLSPDRILNHYDVERFVWVAKYGYENIAINPQLIAVLPLFPLAIGFLGFIISDYTLAAFILANIFFAISCFFLYFLSKIDFNEKISLNAVLFFSIFPTVYFLHTGYSDSMFLALAISSFYFARKSKWMHSGILGMLASFTKIFGILLLPALIIEYLEQKKFKLSSVKKDFIFIFLITLGFAVYLALNFSFFGDTLEFIKVQSSNWNREIAPFWSGLSNLFNEVDLNSEKFFYSSSEAVFGIIGLFASLFVFLKMRRSYGIFMVLYLATVLFNSNWVGTPRYVLSIFPMFILFSKYTTNLKWWRYSLILLFLVLLTAYLSFFSVGRWAF